MNTSSTSNCPALFEACSLQLYDRNIFRLTGLPVDATPRDITKQAQKLQMMEEVGGDMQMSQGAFKPSKPPTAADIREAIARMKDPEQRLIDEFFWFWPEKFGDSNGDEALEAVKAGKADDAYQIWRSRENAGSYVAQHNVAVLYHMYAIEWTAKYVDYETNESAEETIKTYWSKSFQRWEKMIEADELWDMLKDRIRSYDDHALTTGYARRIKRNLPEALDKINAEAALTLAERGRMDWAQYHIDFMRETHAGLDDVENTAEMVLQPSKKRVEQYLSSFEDQSKDRPQDGADLAKELLKQCHPIMQLFDLFHGEGSHQRNDLFDGVAETVLQMVINHQKATGDNNAFLTLLKHTLDFANSPHLRERIIKNISIGESNRIYEILKPHFKRLKDIVESNDKISFKLQRVRRELIKKVGDLKNVIDPDDEVLIEYIDSLALALRNISVDAHNKNRDYSTAFRALNEAKDLNPSPKVLNILNSDRTSLNESRENNKCPMCKITTPSPGVYIRLDVANLPPEAISKLLKDPNPIERYINIPCCSPCKAKHDQRMNQAQAAGYQGQAAGSSGCLVTLALPLALGASTVYCALKMFA